MVHAAAVVAVVVVVVDGHVKGLILISEILVSPFLITVFFFLLLLEREIEVRDSSIFRIFPFESKLATKLDSNFFAEKKK